MCVSHVVSGQGVLTMDSVHSLPSVVLPVVKSSYSHCKVGIPYYHFRYHQTSQQVLAAIGINGIRMCVSVLKTAC